MNGEHAKPLAALPIDAELNNIREHPYVVSARAGEGAIAAERRRRTEWHQSRQAGRFPLGRDHQVGGVRCRTHTTTSDAPATLIWLHGGGWVYGEPEGDEAMLQRFATDAHVDVVAVDYRLAPEHPYPAALLDVLAVYDAIAHPGKPAILAGASAGATLAAAACLFLRDHDRTPPAGQLLICPPLDDRAVDDDAGPLRRADMHTYWATYLAGAEADSYAAPDRASSLRDLPPAYVFTTSSDPLRMEGWRYAARLAAEGVEVTARFLPGGYHGFEYEAPEAALTRTAVTEWVDALRAFISRDAHAPGRIRT